MRSGANYERPVDGSEAAGEVDGTSRSEPSPSDRLPPGWGMAGAGEGGERARGTNQKLKRAERPHFTEAFGRVQGEPGARNPQGERPAEWESLNN